MFIKRKIKEKDGPGQHFQDSQIRPAVKTLSRATATRAYDIPTTVYMLG